MHRCRLFSVDALGDIGYQGVVEPDPRDIPHRWRIVAKGTFQDSEDARAPLVHRFASNGRCGSHCVGFASQTQKSNHGYGC